MGIVGLLSIFAGLLTGIILGYKISKKYLMKRFLENYSEKRLSGKIIYNFGLAGWFISIIPAIFSSFLFGGTFFGGLFENLGDNLGGSDLFIVFGIYVGISLVIVVVGLVFTYISSMLADIWNNI